MRTKRKTKLAALLLGLVLLAALGFPLQRIAAQDAPLPSGSASLPLPEEAEPEEEPDEEEGDNEEPEEPSIDDGEDEEEPGEEDEDPGEEDTDEDAEEEPDEEDEDPEEDEEPEEEVDEEENQEEEEDQLEDEPEIAPTLIELDLNSVIVETYAELAEAIQGNNAYTNIYLGANITGDNTVTITVPASKPNLLISGTPPNGSGGPYTFTQYESGDSAYCIRVDNAAINNVTIADMVVEGRNYYGIVYVNVRGVTTTHQGITYRGPQPAWNTQGTVVFQDCNISLEYLGPNNVNEVVECTHLVLSGKVDIQRASASNANSTFWIYSSSGSITISPGANVTINTNTYLVYTPGFATFTVGEGAIVDIRCGRGFTEQQISRLTIANNAYFSYTQTGGEYTMSLGNTLSVGQGATFICNRQSATTSYAALRMLDSGGSITFDNPERVEIYAVNTAALNANGATMNITTGALNMWTANPGSIDTATRPTYQWNKLGQQDLTLTATFSGFNPSGVTTNLVYDPANPYANDPANAVLNTTTFRPANSFLITLGRTPLSIDTVTSQTNTATGRASAGPVYASYTSGGAAASAEGTASGGSYSIPLTVPADADTYFTVDSFASRLWSRQFEPVEGADGTLYFVNVPSALPFAGGEIPTEAVYVPRAQPGWAIQVADERFAPTGFSITASIDAPMTASLGGGATATLPDALVFVDDSGTATALSDAPIQIYSSTETTGGNFTISWPNNRGPLLYVTPGNVLANVEYRTTITWTLNDSP